MVYRPRTNDFVIDGNVYDIYSIKKTKREAIATKLKIQSRYKMIRILPRSDGYYVLVR